MSGPAEEQRWAEPAGAQRRQRCWGCSSYGNIRRQMQQVCKCANVAVLARGISVSRSSGWEQSRAPSLGTSPAGYRPCGNKLLACFEARPPHC